MLLLVVGALATIVCLKSVVRSNPALDTGPKASYAPGNRELLQNPGFEGIYSGAARGWRTNYWGDPAPTFKLGRDTRPGYVRDGRSSQRFRLGSFGDGAADLVQSLRFREGHAYRASVWIKASRATPVTILLRRDTYPWSAYAIKTVLADAKWQRVTIRGSAPAEEDGSFRVAPKISGTTVWVDGASLTDVTPASGGEPASLPGVPIPATYFGMHTNQLSQAHGAWPPGDQGMLRLWDSGVNWPLIEASNNVWDWNRLDYLVDQAQKHDVDVIYTLGLTPRWAASDTSKAGPYENSSTTPPTNMEDWRDYVRTVATRYKGKIKYYELWNEPDYRGFYSGDVDQMVQMSRVAYEELKRIDPGITIISPGLSDGQGMSWLDKYLFEGGGKYVDVIGYHWKFDLRPEDTMARVDNVRELMRSYGIADKPLFNTEGAASRDPTTSLGADEARGSVARPYILFWAHGVSNLNWFAWDIQVPVRVSLSRADDRTPTAAGVAYGQTVAWLRGARMSALSAPKDGTYVAQITRPGGYRGWIVWNESHHRKFAIPPGWRPTLERELSGRATDLAGATSVEIGPAPILLENPDYNS